MKKYFYGVVAFLLSASLSLAAGLGGGGVGLHGVPTTLSVDTLTASSNVTSYKFTQSAGGASNSFNGPINVTGTGSQLSTTTFTGGVTMNSTLNVNSNITTAATVRYRGYFNKYLNANASYFQATSGDTFISTIPNGAATTSGFFATDRSDYSNNSNVTFGVDSTAGYAFINSGSVGSHSTLPFAISFDGTNKITVANDGTIASTKACDTNYTRTSPNYCLFTGSTGGGALTASSCTTITAPTGAKQVDYLVQLTAAAANVAGQVRYAQVVPYTTSGCSTSEGNNAQLQALEQVAEPALTVLVKDQQVLHLNVHSGSSYVLFTRDGGGESSAYGVITGYRD